MSAAGRIRAGLRGVWAALTEIEGMDLVPRLTLAILILYSGAYWYIHVPMTVVCIAGLVFRGLHRNRWYWLGLTVVMAWGNFLNWFDIDNHKFLMTYWCLAIYSSLVLPNAEEVLASNARVLVGLCFALATLWKVLTPDYLTGGFFQFSLLSDPRFRSLAETAGGLSSSAAEWNRVILGELSSFDSTMTVAALRSAPGIAPLARGVTWWTILLEGLIAVAFLLPRESPLGKIRNLSLLVFAVTTYAVAHVVGYGWVLMAMGAAQCLPVEKRSRALYVAVFFLIQIYTAPWSSILRSFGAGGGGV